jgi:hypothetical protein
MMLRNSILAVALVLLAIAAAAALVEPAVRAPALMLALLVAAIAFENRRYRHRSDERPEGMEPGAERFVDPETGKTMRVWTGPQGERRYVEE